MVAVFDDYISYACLRLREHESWVFQEFLADR